MCGRENMLPSELNSDAPGCFFGLTPGQTYERVHLPGDPLILVVNNLTPGPHVEIPDIQYGQLSADNIPVYGEFRKKGNPQVLSQQADDEFRVANLQKGG